jgi:hypothetical protein
MRRPITASALLGEGSTPVVCVVNQATVPLGHDLQDLVDALQVQADQVAAVWGTPANLILDDVVRPKCWGLLLLDDADQAGVLGYHNVTQEGLPLGKAFLHTSEQDNDDPATVVSHELCEMLADPDANTFKLWTPGQSVLMAVLEIADAVEADSYNVTLDNGHVVPVSNWVFPSWFQSFSPPTVKLDYMGLCKQPFEIRPGGYLPVLNVQTQQWQQLMGPGRHSSRQRNRSMRRMQAKL